MAAPPATDSEPSFPETPSMTRRPFLAALSALGLGPTLAAAQGPTPKIEKIVLTDAEWQKRLSPAAYQVLRHEGTERPGSSPLNAEKRKGRFHCAGCDLPLFSSETKFESGTGWPSFYAALPGAVGTKTDLKMMIRARSTTARAATATRATSSTTARRRPASAIATTASP
jgi:peptide-methionine (R)-S-oxide reductase